jgi:hypothetical protein
LGRNLPLVFTKCWNQLYQILKKTKKTLDVISTIIIHNTWLWTENYVKTTLTHWSISTNTYSYSLVEYFYQYLLYLTGGVFIPNIHSNSLMEYFYPTLTLTHWSISTNTYSNSLMEYFYPTLTLTHWWSISTQHLL